MSEISMLEMTALGNSKIEIAAAAAARPVLVNFDTSVDPWSGDVIQTYYRPKPWTDYMTQITRVDRRTFKRTEMKVISQTITSSWRGDTVKTEKEPVEVEIVKTLEMRCHITPEMQALYDSMLPAMKEINNKVPYRMISGVRSRDEIYNTLVVGDEVRVRPIVVLTRAEWVVWWRAY
jgi:hypothetical protein